MSFHPPPFTVITAISDPGATVAARQLIHRHPRFEIVREVPNAVMSIEACSMMKPDLLIMADSSPGLRGSEVLGEVRLASPATQVILVAAHDAEYLHKFGHEIYSATISVPDSITHALDAVAEAYDDPDDTSAPERRRTDRRERQDWSQVFAERRVDGRRDAEEVQ